MFDSVTTTRPGTRQVLDQIRAARRTELTAAANQLTLAAQWADLHPVPRGGTPAGWGEVDLHGEGLLPLAGEGTPAVAEFAPAELAAHLSTTHDAGKQRLADALELRDRLPRLWHHVQTGRLPAWRARQAAAATTTLSSEAVTWVDQVLAADPDHLTAHRVDRVVEEAVLHHDPDRALADEQHALADRHVTLVHDAGPATTEIHMRLDTLDALHLDDTLGDLATTLRKLGDTDPLDVRRAKAVGVLADPQLALDLLTGANTDPTPHGAARVQLHLHLDQTALTTGAGGTLERLGAATRELLTDWLGRPDLAGVTVRPVLDLARADAVDAHDPPSWMREAAVLRDATCVFPSCTRDSRHSDLDHIRPWVDTTEGGPPGQTSLTNLAPLCRTHHRIKTHTTWDYARLADNHYLWTTPTGDLIAVHTRRRRT